MEEDAQGPTGTKPHHVAVLVGLILADMTSRAFVAPALAAVLILTGCTSTEHPSGVSASLSGELSAGWTAMPRSPRHTATAGPASKPAPAPTPAPTPTAETFVTKVEFLGSGEATIIYNREGTQSQENVTLPYEHVYRSSEYYLSDPYLAAGTTSLSGGNAGCRITVNNQVVDELLPTPTQTSAFCTTLR